MPPPLADLSYRKFRIERMKGGASNRIISIRVADTMANPLGREDRPALDPYPPEERDALSNVNDDADTGIERRIPSATGEGVGGGTEELNLPSGDYVLRIPRWGSQSCQHEVATLRFVHSRISVQVPTVAHSDTSSGDDNPLGSPYVLQRRIPGQRLDEVWENLNNAQRLLICLDMARLFTQLMEITNTSGGIPDVEHGPAADGTLSTVDFRFPGDGEGLKRKLNPQPPVEMLCERLARWGHKYPQHDGTSPYHGAIEMVQYMQAANHTFGAHGSAYYFNHGDLFPRNIMVEVTGKDSAFISGILDWDDAHFAPAVISFSPPAWLWMAGFWKDFSDEGYLEEEDLWEAAEAEPKDEESKQIKALFDMVVGSQFLRYSYSPDAKAARKIWRAAYETMGKSWVESEMERMYMDWKSGQPRQT